MRKFAVSILLAVVVLFLPAIVPGGTSTALATTFSVTNLNDSGPGSLRQAVENANTTSGPDTITFSVSGVIYLSSSLNLTDPGTTIDATGQSVTVDGSVLPFHPFNLTTESASLIGFTINSPQGALGVNLDGCTRPVTSFSLKGMTILAGTSAVHLCSSSVSNVSVSDSTLTGTGSNGIAITPSPDQGGSLTLSNFSVARSKISGQSGIQISADGAGNVLSVNGVSITNSTVTATMFAAIGITTLPGNTARMTVNNVTVSGNTVFAQHSGVFIYTDASDTSIQRITVSDNPSIRGIDVDAISIGGANASNRDVFVNQNGNLESTTTGTTVAVRGKTNVRIQVNGNQSIKGAFSAVMIACSSSNTDVQVNGNGSIESRQTGISVDGMMGSTDNLSNNLITISGNGAIKSTGNHNGVFVGAQWNRDVQVNTNTSITGGINGVMIGSRNSNLDSSNSNVTVNGNKSITGQTASAIVIGDAKANNLNITVSGNGPILGPGSAGAIFVRGLSNSVITVSNNTSIIGDGEAISIATSSTISNSDITISGNGPMIGRTGGGIWLRATSNTKVTVTGNGPITAISSFSGVFIRGTTVNSGISIGNNAMTGGAEGIRIVGGNPGSGNSIVSNNIYRTGTGIYISDSNFTIRSNNIYENQGAGIWIFSGTGNRITQNSIYSNGGLGIDLDGVGVTLNDLNDGDAGPNNLQNFPVLTAVTASSSTTNVRGNFNSTPNTTFTLEFFTNPAGSVEGKTFLESKNVVTDANGNSSFEFTFPATLPTGGSITATATDPGGNTSEFSRSVLVGPISAPGEPVQSGTLVNVSATFRDYSDDMRPHTALWNWGDGSTLAGSLNESNGSGTVTGSHTYAVPGVYTVALTVTAADGSAGQSVFQYVVVYDPSAGFVTGGGWITSPAGAYTPNPSLTGKANFGFVSKYQNGANVPEGNTQFYFHAANFNFHSTSYEWLVIAGAKAQYKGSGTINGSGDYAFLLTAIDGNVNGGGGIDRFRLKVWNKGSSGVIYDNQMNGSDVADPTTILGGGSIVIHK